MDESLYKGGTCSSDAVWNEQDCGLTVCVSMLRQPTCCGEHSDWSAHFLLTTTLSPRESMICSVWQKSSPTENHIIHVYFKVRDNI